MKAYYVFWQTEQFKKRRGFYLCRILFSRSQAESCIKKLEKNGWEGNKVVETNILVGE